MYSSKMTKSKSYSIRQILVLRGEDPDSEDQEVLDMKEELEKLTVIQLLTMIKEIKENPVPTFMSMVGSCT